MYNSGLLSQARPSTGATYDYETAPADLVARVQRIADVCERWEVTVPEVALSFVRAHPAVVATVVGARTKAQVESNVARAHSDVPAALWDELRAEGLLAPGAPVPAAGSPS